MSNCKVSGIILLDSETIINSETIIDSGIIFFSFDDCNDTPENFLLDSGIKINSKKVDKSNILILKYCENTENTFSWHHCNLSHEIVEGMMDEEFEAIHEFKDNSISADDDSASKDDQEINLHIDRACKSVGNKSMDFFENQNKLENSDTDLAFVHHCDTFTFVFKEMKFRHEKEILRYEQDINELKSKLNSKVKETEDLILKNFELQKKYEQLQKEKCEWINKMSEEFVAQKKCQKFLESGAIEEIKRLKLQVQRLEEEKSNVVGNSFLKGCFLLRWTRALLSMIGFPFF